jgi:VCBS repeat-containing protein
VKCKKTDNQNTQPVIEELEPRILFSAGLEGIVFDSLSLDSDSIALYQNKDEITLQSTSAVAAETVVSSRQELVFIDSNTPDYQLLIDDLLANNNEDRTINLVLLDSSKNGIQQISDALANYNGLDAVHIISHGSDGTVQLGNSQLDLDSLLANTDAISGWGNAFSIDGDLLFYGCDLAATENGQSLINSVAKLTGTDVAASEDSTGNSLQGGDWELEYQQGQLESGIIFSQKLQQQWQGTLGSWFDETGTPIGGPGNGNDIYVGDNNPNTGINGSNGNDTIYGAGGNDNLGGGNGDDVIIGGVGDDIISGQGGTNVLYGGAGNDQISGGSGSDVIIGGGGNDTLNGGSDSDFFYFTGAQNGDTYTVDGNSGSADTIDLTEFGSGNITYNAGSISVDLGSGQSFTINYANIDNFIDADSSGNHAPGADAGIDQIINVGSLVTLDASASSDLDPDTLTYRWVQLQGPWTGIHNSTTQSPSFITPATPANLKFAVIVSDGLVQNIDAVNVTVSTPTVNQPPTITKEAIFTDNGQTLGSSSSSFIKMGDVDGDGDLDLVVANFFSQANKVYLNNGSGSFTDSGQNLGSSSSHSIELGDIDGDGDLDMVVGNLSSQPNKIYTNDGNGVFTDSGQSLGSSDSTHLLLGDMDGDGDLDLVVGNFGGQADKIYTNNGGGIFTDSGQSLGAANTRFISIGDIDNDGDLDLITGNQTTGNQVYFNNGSGILTDSLQSLGTSTTYGIELGDIDNDGDLDLIEASQTGPNIIYTNNGSGVFVDSGQNLGNVASNSLDLGDIDGDGDLDLIFGNNDTVADQIYINDGNGAFTSGQSLGAGVTRGVVFSDIDNDGDLDLVNSIFVNSANLVYVNDSTISAFAPLTLNEGDPEQTIISTAIIGDIDSADFDGGYFFVSYSSLGDSGDQLSVNHQGTGAGQIGFNGSNVSYEGINIGILNTLLKGENGSSLFIHLNANATPVSVTALLNNITFQNTSNTPAANRTLLIQANDGDGGDSTPITQIISITAQNDDPFNAGSLPPFFTGSEDISFNINLSSINVNDADAGSNALTLTLTTSTGGNLTALAGTGITIGGSGTSVVALTGNLTDLNNYLDIVGNVSYLHSITHTNGSPSDTLKIDITDNGNSGAGGSGTITLGTRNINILSVNDAPITDNVSASGNEDDTSIALTLTGSDVDGSVDRFRIGTLPANGILYIDAGLTTVVTLGSENNATGEALTLYFVPDANWAGITTFQFAARDNGGILDTSPATATITVTLLNDAPTVNATASDTGTEDTDLVYTHAQLLALVSATDADDLDAVLTIAITNVNNGSLIMAGGTGGLGTIFTFTPAPNSNANLTFDYQVSDDNAPTPASSAIGTATVTINAINDAPVVTTSLTPLNYAEQTRINIDSALTLSDIDDSQINGATVSITNGLVPSEDTLNFVNQFGITGNYNSTTGILTLTGTTSIANYETALRTIKYRNSSDAPDTTTRIISFVVDDGTNTSIPVTRDIVINPRNDAPQITAPLLETTPQNTGLVFSGANGNAISISDPDLGNVEITLTVTNGTLSLNGIANLAFTSGSGIEDTTMTFSGNQTDINNALDGLDFNPDNGFTGSEMLQIIVDDQGNIGSGIPLVDSTRVLITIGETVPVATDDPGDFSSDISSLNPVGNWRLGEANGTTVVDAGSAGANGTFNGPSLGQSGALTGDSDTAVHFDGVDDYIEITHSNDFLLDNGTFQFWFNPDTIGVQQTLLSKDHIGFGTGGHATIWMTGSGTIQVRLQSTTTDIFIESSNPVTAGQWHHVAFSFGSNGMELYVDGVLADVNGYTGGLATTSGGSGNIESLVLGASKHTSSPGTIDSLIQHFQGSIDEVSITGNQLDAEQIQNIFTAGLQNYTIAENTSLNVATSEGVLINDADADGDLLTAILVNGPSFASSFTLNSDGSFDYTPNAGFDGTDSFTYQASDGSNNSNLATVTITVTGTNDAPVTSPVTLTSIAEDSGPRTITQAELLSNASDPDGPSLTATGLSIITGNGSLADNGDGTWTYSSDLNDNTNVSFSYTITDSVATITGSASLDITPINDIPVITSNGGGNAATVTLVENTTAVTDVDATDADLDTLNYSISGGTDAALFNIDSSTGLLTFITAPDFEIPGDFDANNVYEVSVQVSDGSSVDTQAISVTVTDVAGTLIVTTNSDIADGNTTSIEALITDKGADGEISLREAILAANNTVNGAAPDEIHFNIGSGLQTITPTSELPFLTDAVILDATSQPGYNGTPRIQLDGSNAASATAGLTLLTNNSTVRGFIVHSFVDEGIEVGGWGGFGGGDNNIIENNWVGIDATGAARPNADNGILITDAASNNIIRNNVVSGNATAGIVIRNTGSDNNVVEGNLIGVSVDGSTSVGNATSGIEISDGASNNRIGTNADGLNDITERNIISGNLGDGIFIIGTDTTNNLIQGNYIGTDISGLSGIGNQDDGIDIRSNDNTIGGTTAASGNLISGNNDDGILLRSTNATGNIIQGNTIGTDISSSNNLSNNDGIQIDMGATNNLIGGTNVGAGNQIAFNNQNGIHVTNTAGIQNAILGNSIHNNSGLSIDLGGDGVTANDAGDNDSGSNNGQNYPVLISALINPDGSLSLAGTLNSTANTTFRIEFFTGTSEDASGNGEARTYVGSVSVTTDTSGNAQFNTVVTSASAPNNFITASATVELAAGVYGDTSEFAANVNANIPVIPDPIDPPIDPEPTPDPDDEPAGSDDPDPGGESTPDLDLDPTIDPRVQQRPTPPTHQPVNPERTIYQYFEDIAETITEIPADVLEQVINRIDIPKTMLPLQSNIVLWNAIDTMLDELDDSFADAETGELIIANTIRGTTWTLSAGFVAWILRGGSLVAAAMSSIPIWRGLDPLPVIAMSRKEREKRDKDKRVDQQEEDDLQKEIGDLIDGARLEDPSDSRKNSQ